MVSHRHPSTTSVRAAKDNLEVAIAVTKKSVALPNEEIIDDAASVLRQTMVYIDTIKQTIVKAGKARDDWGNELVKSLILANDGLAQALASVRDASNILRRHNSDGTQSLGM